MNTETESKSRLGILAVNVGLGANALLALLKTAIGILGHSPALLADGINSTSDTAYYVVVRIFMHLARKPPDREHPYGHSQLESIAALVVGSFVVTTAIAIFWNAVNDVYELLSGRSEFGGAGAAALWVALGTVVLKIVLTIFTRRVGERLRNPAVRALARDHRNDIFSAGGAAVGIFLGRAGYPWGDPLVGAFVALIVLKTGIEILRDASADLMDTVPSEELKDQALAALAGIEGIQAVEEVHAHRFGPYLVLNITLGVDGGMTVAEGDRIASLAEKTLTGRIALVRRVYVHYHPARIGLVRTSTQI